MKNFSKNRSFKKGLTLVEVLVSASIVLFFLISLVSVHNLYLRVAFSNSQSVKATLLAEEALEIVRFMRDASWQDNIETLSKNTEYSLVFDLPTNSWDATTTNIFIDSIYERRVVLSDVYRNASSQIVSAGGVLDPDTVRVDSSVSWARGLSTTTKSISTYISNILDN